MTAHWKNRVPRVRSHSRRALEDHASKLALTFYQESVTKLSPIPIEHFFEFLLPKGLSIETGVSDSLPFGVEGQAQPKSGDSPAQLLLSGVVFDGMISGDGRARFTDAHECAHAILHLDELQSTLTHASGPRLYRRHEIERWRDPEWQANVWAASFLMPTPAVQAFVDRYGADPSQLSGRLQVSYSAAEMRLRLMRNAGLID